MKCPSDTSATPLPQSILYDGTAGTPTQPVVTTYTVTFNLNGVGGAAPSGRSVAHGAAVGVLPTVTRSGYAFLGWYTAADGGDQVTAETVVTGDATYYAHWTKVESEPPAWTPVAKEESMIVYATVMDVADGASVDADGTMMAAFSSDGECRGVAEIMEGPSGRLFQLTVGVTSQTESGISLRLWDAESGTIYEIAETLSCNPECQIGGIATPVTVKAKDDDVTTYEFMAGMKSEVNVELIGYKVSGLPSGLKYDARTGKVAGVAKVAGEYEATFTKKGEADITAVFVVRDEEVSVGCAGLSGGTFTTGVAGDAGGIPLEIESETGVKSVSVTKLPAGMKYDTKTGLITGAPTKPGDYNVVVTVTTKSGAKRTETIAISVAALPDNAVGVFNGFIKAEDGEENAGTFQLTTTDAGKLTAKVVTAAGSYSFSGTCWDAVGYGVYFATLTTKKGETLALSLDSAAGWDKDQLTGTFAAAVDASRDVVARRNAFGKTWYFAATGDAGSGWTLSYAANAKEAVLTVTLNADGSTKIAGKLGALSVNASGYADVTGLASGVIYADFASVVSVKEGRATLKRPLSVRTNLWFDRLNEHAEGIGTARTLSE